MFLAKHNSNVNEKPFYSHTMLPLLQLLLRIEVKVSEENNELNSF